MKRLLNFVLLFCVAPALAQSYETVYSAHLRNGFSISHYKSEVVGESTRLYLGNDRASGYADVPTIEIVSIDSEQRLLPQPRSVPPPNTEKPKPIPELIASAADRTRIDGDFISSVIRAESSFNPRARSPKGAQGLMQLMPKTAAQLGVRNAYDAEANINGGAEYLRRLLARYHGDAQRALAAYNAGPHRVQQYGGVPPYRETRAYVARVINDYNRKKRASNNALAAAQSQKEATTASAGSGAR